MPFALALGHLPANAMPWMKFFRIVHVICVALLLVSQAGAAPSPPVVVRFSEAIPTPYAQRLLSSFRSQLRDLTWVESDDAHRENALCVVTVGVVTVDAHGEKGLELQFADGQGNPIGKSRVIPPSTREIVVTEAASIVRAVVIAQREVEIEEMPSTKPATPQLAVNSEPGMASPPAPAPFEPVAVISTADSAPALPAHTNLAFTGDFQLRFRMLYIGTIYGSDLPWVSGVRTEALVALGHLVHAGAAYAFDPDANASTGEAAIRIHRHMGTALIGIEHRARSWACGVDAGVDVATWSRTTRSTGASIAAGSDASYWTAGGSLRAYALARIPGAERLHVDLAFGVDVFPWPERFVVREISGVESNIFSPNAIQPQAGVGVGFDAW